MKLNLHYPTVKDIVAVPRCDERGSTFPIVVLTDYSGGSVDFYPGDDWEHWDAMVAAVEQYRAVVHG